MSVLKKPNKTQKKTRFEVGFFRRVFLGFIGRVFLGGFFIANPAFDEIEIPTKLISAETRLSVSLNIRSRIQKGFSL
jgi:hypothetical protein